MITSNTTPEQFASIDFSGSTVTAVSIASPPVVTFRLATEDGVPIIGFGSTSKSSTAKFASYPNLGFTIAKLVPGSGGTPSKWVNYIVTTVETNTTPVGLTRPSTDNTGTLVDNKDGTYTYTFYRDVPGIKALVDSLSAGSNNKADLGDLTYNANATHRLVIQIAGAAPGTGSNTPNGAPSGISDVRIAHPVNVIYDFVPATGQAPAASANRKLVANANCQSCHSTLGGLPDGDGASLEFHTGSRNNIEYCVICHTDQRRYGRTEATYDAGTRTFSGSTMVVDGRTVGHVMNFIHKVHVAKVMTKTGYNYGGVAFDGGYSQDIRNCDKCHDSTGASTGGTPLPQASLWKTVANRLACGSCHDGIDFDSGIGLTLADKAAGLTISTGFSGKAHPGNSTDGTCLNSSCHNPGAPADPDLVHKPVTPPNPDNSLAKNLSTELVPAPDVGNSNTNSAWIASNQNRLPAGAIKVAWDVKSVSLDGSRHPVMVFRWLQNGTAVPITPFGSAVADPATGQKEMWPNFMGSPSAYWVWAVPQDNVSNPVDFNASASVYLRSVWNGSIATTSLTGPDASGYYTVTMNNITVPANAKMLTGGMGYSYNVRSSLPLTQTNLVAYPLSDATSPAYLASIVPPAVPNKQGGLIVIAPNKQVVATGFTGRRAIVEDTRCNACHQELGTFTEDAFHAGQRNDGTTCSWCHTANRTNQGWSVDSTNFVHAIHAAEKRTVPFTYDATSPTEGFYDIVYPGVLARCEQCHIPGSYDFFNTASANAAGLGSGSDNDVDKRFFRTVGAGTYASTSATMQYQKSPYVLFDNNYGSAPSATADGAATTLVLSPTVAVCSACHTSSLATSHMEVNGGSFYRARNPDVFSVPGGGAWPPATRGTATVNRIEQCFICHASGKTADIKQVHSR